MKKLPAFLLGAASIFCLGEICNAWDYEGHRFVNQLALASLPADFPAFVKTPEASERIAFLSGEPDRWRNVKELTHFNGPDHYFDWEELSVYGIDPNKLPLFRYDFAAELAIARAQHPEKFAPIDPARNEDHTRQLAGFLPWAIMENFDKLKSSFSSLKAFEKAGTPQEIANAQQKHHVYHGRDGALRWRCGAAVARDDSSSRVGGRKSQWLQHTQQDSR